MWLLHPGSENLFEMGLALIACWLHLYGGKRYNIMTIMVVKCATMSLAANSTTWSLHQSVYSSPDCSDLLGVKHSQLDITLLLQEFTEEEHNFLYLDGLSFSGPEHLLCLQLNLSHQCCKVCLHTGPENESPPNPSAWFMKWGQLIVGDQQQVDSHQKTVQAPLAKLPKAQAQPCFPQHLHSFFLLPLLRPVNHHASIHVSCLWSSLCRAQLACLHNTKLY